MICVNAQAHCLQLNDLFKQRYIYIYILWIWTDFLHWEWNSGLSHACAMSWMKTVAISVVNCKNWIFVFCFLCVGKA